MLGVPEFIFDIAFVDFTLRRDVIFGIATRASTFNQECVAFLFAQWIADIISDVFGDCFADIIEYSRRQLD